MKFGDNVGIEFITGALAAIIDCCLLHSVDTLKVRAQDRRPLLPWSIINGVSPLQRPTVVFKSLYQGFSTNLFLKVPYMAAMFGFNSINRLLLGSLPENTLGPMGIDALSALLTGVEASLLLSPLELIRIQGQNRNKGGLLAATKYTKNKIGISGIMKTVIGFVSEYLENWSKQNYTNIREKAERNYLLELLAESHDFRAIVSSVSVGFFCTILSHPDDVVKTRQQTRLSTPPHPVKEYQSYVSSLRYIAQTEGIRGLWKGSLWRCCVRVPLGLAVINVAHPRIRSLFVDGE